MKVDAFLTPYFPETENLYENSVVVVIDVLRASSTVCAALYNGAKEVIPCESLDKAVTVYNNLSRESRFLGGERNGTMPQGFDAGNSPSEYTSELVSNKSVIISTTNGTKTFLKARQAISKIVGSFTNFQKVCDFLFEFSKEHENSDKKIIFLASGTNGRLSYEDTICAGAFIYFINNEFESSTMTDTALVAKNLYKLHKSDLKSFLSNCEHAQHLKKIGFEKDLDICLDFDNYPVLPIFSGSSIKLYD